MTTPTIFSDVANLPFVAKSEPQGVLAQKAIAAIPASTAAGTNIGMIRFNKGFSLTGLALKSDDLDSGTNVVLDVGYLYDDTTGEDDNAFFNDIDIAQDAGSVIWPIADGLLTGISFTATGDGYLSITTRTSSTTTAGNITAIAQFTYNLQAKMATLAQLRTRILSKLDDGDVQHPTAAQVDKQINLTIDYYETDAFWFSEARTSLVATVNNNVLGGLPSDFKEFIMPDALAVVDSECIYPMIHMTPLEYDSIYVSNSSGLPRYYTYRNGQIEIFYAPDKAYVIKLFYRKFYADLVSDDDSNDFTNKCERLIEYKTLADCLRDYRADFERAAAYDSPNSKGGAVVQNEYTKIKRETQNRTVTGELTTENIIDRGNGVWWGY